MANGNPTTLPISEPENPIPTILEYSVGNAQLFNNLNNAGYDTHSNKPVKIRNKIIPYNNEFLLHILSNVLLLQDLVKIPFTKHQSDTISSLHLQLRLLSLDIKSLPKKINVNIKKIMQITTYYLYFRKQTENGNAIK